MKNHISSQLGLAIVTLAAFPAIALAAPPTATPYYTDETNSYVQDQTSQVMGELNNILCFMGAMGPDLMVNSGDASGNYIALVDKNTCDARGSGGQSNNTGAAYVPAVAHSTRASNSDPMLVKAWLTFMEQGTPQNIKVYASASQAPTATLPYGVFRMDFCGNPSGQTDCASDKGYINATTSGLSFYSTYSHGTDGGTTALQLNASSSSAGSGAIHESHTWGGGGVYDFLFAYNTGYFVRNDGGADVCFDRNPANADESVWRYGLYDAATGARVTRNSGFPIEYTVGGVTSNGYIGYYGLSTQGTGPASGDTVNQVTYGQSGATKTPYTLLKTGGKLLKYTTAEKTLEALNKVTFWYYAQVNVGTVMTAGYQYELYWDNTAGNFVVSGMQPTGSYNMEPLPGGPVAVVNTDMVTANPWGIFGWSQMTGGQFGIKGNEFALLATNLGSVKVQTQTQDVVYPSQYAAITGGLKCINDCPTAALIAASNGGTGIAYSNQGWAPVAEASFALYTLNGTTGNLVDAASGAVVSTATTGTNANGVRSGRLVTPADATAMIAAKNTANVCGGTCTTFNQGDVDFLPVGSSYYVWETGGQPWNQLAILMSGTTPVTFEAPLQVNFVVPTGAKYGSYQGATISLQYGGFGDLWGIPNECIDVATNAACVFSGGSATPQLNQRWTSKFSIPFDATTGVVTAGATTYYVKPLDKEVRLAKVDCAAAGGLSTTGLTNAGLPVVGGWSDPTATVGTKPTVTAAPQVIHGVKQY